MTPSAELSHAGRKIRAASSLWLDVMGSGAPASRSGRVVRPLAARRQFAALRESTFGFGRRSPELLGDPMVVLRDVQHDVGRRAVFGGEPTP
ncbi:hypothetical protein PF008_g21231 [Phytophthora fragariae]|uniref:Uncharacterized protein n=1 Tax=Phytophthora fragariae TaxID=53985 RepID=A0A6G0QXE3_9STRA|nr:hypothetical protein PF008_g21231 [Phytophthora fragariae]